MKKLTSNIMDITKILFLENYEILIVLFDISL